MTDTSSGVIAPRSLRRTALRGGGRARQAAALVGLSAAMLVPGHALAQAAQEEDAPLATINVEDTAIDPNPNAQLGVPFKAKTSGDERRSRPLAETPATITVLTRAQLEQSGYTDLKAILEAQPGVTVGTGENGNAFGDRYIIRGQDVKSDIFVDGLRDPGLQSRESFAVEQIEITKGPSSSFAGRGASGGAVNLITKAATTEFNFAKVTAGYGSDNYIRTTADVNYRLGDNFAIRVNGLFADTDVPYRGLADRRRYGAAISGLFQPTDNLKIILDYYTMRAKDKPDVAGLLQTDAAGNRVPFDVPAYTQLTSDFQKADVDTFTARIKYDLSDNVRLSNTFRYGRTYSAYFISAVNTIITIPTSATTSYLSASFDSGHAGWQDVKYIANQTNLSADVDFLGAKHQLILGAEYTNHQVQITAGSPSTSSTSTSAAYIYTRTGAFNCSTVLGGTNNRYCITDAAGNAVPNLGNLLGQTVYRTPYPARVWEIDTIAAYLMDTVDLSDRLTLFAGVRADHYTFNIASQNVQTGAQTSTYSYSDTLWNGHLGLTYKVGGGGMIYATVSTAADINGGESDTNGAGYGGFITPVNGEVAKPERSWNYEIGTKWNVLDEKLLITAALFRTVKSDVMEGANYNTYGTFNTGKFRVQGFDFSIAGNITDKWSVQGGFTVMRAKVLESTTAANVGKTLANFANVSAEFMTRYQITDKFALGGAFKYKSQRYGGQPDTAAPFSTVTGTDLYKYSQPVPSYFVVDATAEYHLTKNIELRLNVNNLFNKDYYLAVYRGGFFMYKGDKRQIVGTISAKF
ncbi:MAG: TonB-dependent siderophore receptor [Novosphingobium sp.]